MAGTWVAGTWVPSPGGRHMGGRHMGGRHMGALAGWPAHGEGAERGRTDSLGAFLTLPIVPLEVTACLGTALADMLGIRPH